MKLLISLFTLMASSHAFADCAYERTDTGEYVYVCTDEERRPDPDDDQKECWYSYDPQTGENVLVCE